jgi:putative tricarboxylic transport membrane protein
MRSEQTGVVSGIILLIVSAVFHFILIPTQVRLRPGAAVGPEFFPELVVVVIGVLAIVLILTQMKAIKDSGKPFKEDFVFRIKDYLNHAIFITAAIVFLAVVRHLGFVISAVFLTIFLLFFFGSKGVVKNIVIGIIYGIAVYWLFGTIARVNFPVGIFGI